MRQFVRSGILMVVLAVAGTVGAQEFRRGDSDTDGIGWWVTKADVRLLEVRPFEVRPFEVCVFEVRL